MTNKEKLGRGLESLLGEAIGIETGEKVMRLKLAEIQPNEAQPRKQFTQPQMESFKQETTQRSALHEIQTKSDFINKPEVTRFTGLPERNIK